MVNGGGAYVAKVLLVYKYGWQGNQDGLAATSIKFSNLFISHVVFSREL